MRYTARTRSIEWRDDPTTRAAEAWLRDHLVRGDPLTCTLRLDAGQGILNNNVLHDRTGSRQGAGRGSIAPALPGPVPQPRSEEAEMAKLSDLIIAHPEVKSFDELERLVAEAGEAGEMFIEFDIKPDYRDTPRKWEWILEAAFTRGDQLWLKKR
ncbi:hypothetical protein ACFOHS_00195 [Jhaorihella thermophila]